MDAINTRNATEIAQVAHDSDGDSGWSVGQQVHEISPAALVDIRSHFESVVCGLFLMVLAFLAVTGNLAVIYAVFRFRKLRDQVSNLLLVNLSVTDLLSSTLVMAVSDYSIFMDVRTLPPVLCQLQCAANYCLIIVSMVTLACISVDRYIAVLLPLRYCSLVTRRRVLLVLCWPWLQGVLFALPPVLLGWVHYDYWEAVCAIDWQQGGAAVQYYVIIACVLCFLLPACIMMFCYVHIIRQARLCHRHIRPMATATSISFNFKQALKTITSLFVVVIVFFVCMTPFCLTKLLKVVISNSFIPSYLNLASSFLEFFASLANPFIYGIFRREFRFAYRHFIWYLSCKMSTIAPGTFQESILQTVEQLPKPHGKVTDYTMTKLKKRNGVPPNQVPAGSNSTEAVLSSVLPSSRPRKLSEPCAAFSPPIVQTLDDATQALSSAGPLAHHHQHYGSLPNLNLHVDVMFRDTMGSAARAHEGYRQGARSMGGWDEKTDTGSQSEVIARAEKTISGSQANGELCKKRLRSEAPLCKKRAKGLESNGRRTGKRATGLVSDSSKEKVMNKMGHVTMYYNNEIVKSHKDEPATNGIVKDSNHRIYIDLTTTTMSETRSNHIEADIESVAWSASVVSSAKHSKYAPSIDQMFSENTTYSC